MTTEQQPQPPKLNIYYVDSTRADVHLLRSEHLPNQIVSDKLSEFCASSLQSLLSISRDGKLQRFAQRLITCFTLARWFWLRNSWTFTKFFGSRIPKQRTKVYRPQLLFVVDPFTRSIVAVHLMSDQAGHE